MSKVSAKLADMEEAITIDYPVPETLAKATEDLGEDVVYSRFKSALVVDLQAFLRTRMKQQLDKDGTLDEASLQEAVNDWKPGVKRAGKTAEEKIADLMAGLTEDEKNEILAKHIG